MPEVRASLSDVSVCEVEADSPLLNRVETLWRANSSTLGFFPDGAFSDYASRGRILTAVDSSGQLLGYLLYYCTRRTALSEVRLVHLCVEETARNKGVARALVGELRARTQSCRGVRVRCRRDFPASSLWPRLGFCSLREQPGRSGQPVTEWWLDYGHPSLFTALDEERLRSKPVAVVDACVFFEWLEDTFTPTKSEAEALLSDWLQADIEFRITPELMNEIDRGRDAQARRLAREFARAFEWLGGTAERVMAIQEELRPVLGGNPTDSRESDLRQLAHAIAGEADFFVTFDTEILRTERALYEKWGVSSLRPGELIARLDELLREAEYRPARVAGSGVSSRRVRGTELDKLVCTFLLQSRGERKQPFLQRLSSVLAQPGLFETTVLAEESGRPVALMASGWTDENRLVAPILRVAPGPLEETLAIYLVSRLVLTGSKVGCALVEIADPELADSLARGASQYSFADFGGCWRRLVLRALEPPAALARLIASKAAKFPELGTTLPILAQSLEAAGLRGDSAALLALERALWPTKIAELDVPSFIVPIKPIWAAALFDESLAGHRLLHADAGLILRVENVYYRAPRPAVLTAPGRVLWYVSQSRGTPGTGELRGYSALEEVSCGDPSSLFKRFRRLGVLNWNDVQTIGRRSATGNIQAFRFSNSEALPCTIAWPTLQETLKQNEGRRHQIQSPVRVSTRTFDKLYGLGIGRA